MTAVMMWLRAGGWKWIAGALIILAAFGAGWWKGYAPEHEAHLKDNATAEAFATQVVALGKKAETDKLATEKKHNEDLAHARTDADGARNNLASWMRQHPTSGGGSRIVPDQPAAPIGTDRTGQRCYDAAELDGALRFYRGDVRGYVAEGRTAVIDRGELAHGWPR